MLGAVSIPTLLVNAQDDPFLTPECFPVDVAERNPAFHLEMPRHGGHVGFVGDRQAEVAGWYWSERRAVEWLADVAPRGKKRRAVQRPARRKILRVELADYDLAAGVLAGLAGLASFAGAAGLSFDSISEAVIV